MRYLILSILLIVPCVNSYSQKTVTLPPNTPAYLVLNNTTTAVDSLIVREYRNKETKHLINRMNKAGEDDNAHTDKFQKDDGQVHDLVQHNGEGLIQYIHKNSSESVLFPKYNLSVRKRKGYTNERFRYIMNRIEENERRTLPSKDKGD